MNNSIGVLIGRLNEFVFNPIIGLLFALAIVIFIWGVVELIWKSDSDIAREDGRKHIIWGVIGMFIMFAVFAIMRIIAKTLGVDQSILNQIPFQ